MLPYLLVAAGSAAGGMVRYGTSELFVRLIGAGFPWGTIVINVVGSFAIGLLNALVAPDGGLLLGSASRQLLMVGFLGGYTTFSAFSLQSLQLLQAGRWTASTLYILSSVILCLAGVAIGQFIAKSLR